MGAASFISAWFALCILLGGCTGRDDTPEPVTIWLAGDVHLGAGQADILAPLAHELDSGLGIVNLEGPVGPGPSSAGRLQNSAAALSILARHHVIVAGVANNHAGDLGASGAGRTVSALRAAGIEPAGGDRIAVVRQGGLRIAVTAHEVRAQALDTRLLEATLARAKKQADVVVAMFHVVGPPSYLPRAELVAAVDAAVAAGARIVAAHGTHALARVERRGPAIVAWGLGNLAFACECTNEQDGLIVRVDIAKTADGADIQTGDAMRATVIPIQAGLHGAPARPSTEPDLVYDLLESLKSSPLRRAGAHAYF